MQTGSFAAGQAAAPKSILRRSTSFSAGGTGGTAIAAGQAAGSGGAGLPAQIAMVTLRRDKALAEYNRLLQDPASMGREAGAVAPALEKAAAEVGKLAAELRQLSLQQENALRKQENALALQQALAEEESALPSSSMGREAGAVAPALERAAAEVGKQAAEPRLTQENAPSTALQQALAEEDSALPSSSKVRIRRPISVMIGQFPQPLAKPSDTGLLNVNKPLPPTPDEAGEAAGAASQKPGTPATQLARQVAAEIAQSDANAAAVARETEVIRQSYQGIAEEVRKLQSAMPVGDRSGVAETRQVLSRLMDLENRIGTTKIAVREELLQIELELKAVRQGPAGAIDMTDLAGKVRSLRDKATQFIVDDLTEGLEKTQAKLTRAQTAGGAEARDKAGEAKSQLIDIRAKLDRLLDSELAHDEEVDA